MSGTDEVTGLRFGRVASTIAVGDLDRARAFYCGVLGMRVVFENGDPVGFVILERDSLSSISLSSRAIAPAATTSLTYWCQTPAPSTTTCSPMR